MLPNNMKEAFYIAAWIYRMLDKPTQKEWYELVEQEVNKLPQLSRKQLKYAPVPEQLSVLIETYYKVVVESAVVEAGELVTATE